ncbi:MAG: hypothetical protein ACRDV0_00150, partial [Acidimicrobiales bacterium]
ALTMIALGSVAYALAGREIKGRWSWDLVVPGVNVAAVSSMVTRQLGDPGPWRRAVTDVAVCALYALQYRAHPVLAFVPALVALDLSTSLARLNHRLGAESGRATSAS